jgi:hypothetical protein
MCFRLSCICVLRCIFTQRALLARPAAAAAAARALGCCLQSGCSALARIRRARRAGSAARSQRIPGSAAGGRGARRGRLAIGPARRGGGAGHHPTARLLGRRSGGIGACPRSRGGPAARARQRGAELRAAAASAPPPSPGQRSVDWLPQSAGGPRGATTPWRAHRGDLRRARAARSGPGGRQPCDLGHGMSGVRPLRLPRARSSSLGVQMPIADPRAGRRPIAQNFLFADRAT